MEIDEFKQIVTAFADTPADIDLTKGELIIQLHDEIIDAHLKLSDLHGICVVENDTSIPARQWIVSRLARLPLLAQRILSYVDSEPNFVTPRGIFLDQLERNADEIEIDIDDALTCTRETLSMQIPGASSILYLTSDAGEGKTTLINQLARSQAEMYINKKTDWLLVPVPLGGRSLLRFDDVVIASLVNRLRFQMLYFEAFVHLVRLGVLVPAFDGFEEMFVESTTGEAISALGNLVKTLRSSGNVLIAARKAYFEYKSFGAQARLFDSIETEDVRFARLGLKRWDRDNFIEYSKKRNIFRGEDIFNEVSDVIGDMHPLLTRAVLVHRLLDIATEVNDRKKLLQELRGTPEEYFRQFVRAIIDREVREKWIDRSGEPQQPLLSSDEHHELLALLAQEMWLNNVGTVRQDHLELIAELFCESKNKSATISRQVKDRIKYHALIIQSESYKQGYSFDHDDFRYHFLGEAIGRLIKSSSDSELRTILQVGPLPDQALDSASNYLRFDGQIGLTTCQFLLQISATEGPTSFVRENIGGLLIRLLNDTTLEKPLTITQVHFPADSLVGRHLTNVEFNNCYFQFTDTTNTNLNNCKFIECTFERMELSSNLVLKDVTLIKPHVTSAIPSGSETPCFDPDIIEVILRQKGFLLPQKELSQKKDDIPFVPDPDLVLVERALRRFLRSTTVSEDVLKVKMGKDARYFIRNILPRLLDAQVLRIHTFSSKNTHYRLNVPMQSISSALSKSNGNLSDFLSALYPKTTTRNT